MEKVQPKQISKIQELQEDRKIQGHLIYERGKDSYGLAITQLGEGWEIKRKDYSNKSEISAIVLPNGDIVVNEGTSDKQIEGLLKDISDLYAVRLQK